MTNQDYLEHAFEIGNGEFTDIVCQDCANNWAKDNGLNWSGGVAYDSFTERQEDSEAFAGDLSTFSDTEADYPLSCCGRYLDTRLTPDGVEYLKEFPKAVQRLYNI